MRKLVVFDQISLDGYFSDINGDISWAHKHDPEWKEFVAENANSGGLLLLGRITYDLMASYWPTPQAKENDPEVAERMNNLPKVVISRTLDNPRWNNTKVVKSNLASEVRKLKDESGKHITILGSGSIVKQLAQEGLIDEYKIVVNPIVLGKGRNLFEGIDNKIPLKPKQTRSFNNGNVLLCYGT